MKNLGHIYEGWTKALGLVEVSEENKKLALKRVRACVDCPHAKEQWLKKIIDGVLKNDELGSGIVCTLCTCPVQQKALVIEERCPDPEVDRWKNTN